MKFPITVLLLALPAWAAAGDAPQTLPARFQADLVSVHPRTADGQTLHLYTDTGGGGNLLSAQAAARLQLPSLPLTDPDMRRELGPQAQGAPWPTFAAAAGLPAPLGGQTPPLLIVPSMQMVPGQQPVDGLLGSRWFADRVWTWDYRGGRLLLHTAPWQPPRDARPVPLGFKTAGDGRRLMHMPRIVIRVDGRDLPMLLDTGAMTVLTESALAGLGDRGPAQRATSMIAESVFQTWRRAHPDWRVIENAQQGSGAAMIEVPAVEIAGWRVGPVWFTQRPDAAFHRFMSSMMDATVEGAIGGNALRHFTMTVDYPAAQAWFVCSVDCRPAARP